MTTNPAVRTRFAPSPTGYLHIGGARTTLYSWLFARHHGGTFVLRIEDTDEVRSTAESVTAILDSISWLGLDWDEGPLDFEHEKGPCGSYYQMKRLSSYQEQTKRLLDEGKAYRCYCTREETDAARQAAKAAGQPVPEDPCRRLSDAQRRSNEAAGRKPAVRFIMPDEGETVVDDLIRGQVHFENRLAPDLVIQKTTGGPTYNFACVCDDHAMRISHVIRGDEHLSNTPAQMRIYEALGWQPPKFAHLSMILGPDGTKLSKRHGATSVTEYRDQGFLPEALRNYLALLGWSNTESRQLFAPDELVAAFDLPGCQKNPATFDPVKLAWMNGEYMRALAPADIVKRAEPFLKEAGLFPPPPGPSLERLAALEREKFKLLPDVPGRVDFFYRETELTDKARKTLAAPEAKTVLAGLTELLTAFEPFTEKPLEEAIRAFCARKSLKPGQVFHPLRAAVSGRADGPTLFLMLELLGREAVLARLRKTSAGLGPN
ncbi:MAG: glutamate--tRNA ligase [Elusimicrobia bacterium]|nr:glutamate--tRNA ligase [Elusimicrobiota bacterium]